MRPRTPQAYEADVGLEHGRRGERDEPPKAFEIRRRTEREPEYAYLAARLLLTQLYAEALAAPVALQEMARLYSERFEAYLRRGVQAELLDPALLEWEAPGAYQARIYPIKNGESRRILVRYSEWLERPDPNGSRVYRYRMSTAGEAAEIKELRIEADVSLAGADDVRASHGARRIEGNVTLTKSDFSPRSDFVIELFGESGGQAAYRAEHVAPRRDPRAGVVVRGAAGERRAAAISRALGLFAGAPRRRGVVRVRAGKLGAGGLRGSVARRAAAHGLRRPRHPVRLVLPGPPGRIPRHRGGASL